MGLKFIKCYYNLLRVKENRNQNICKYFDIHLNHIQKLSLQFLLQIKRYPIFSISKFFYIKNFFIIKNKIKKYQQYDQFVSKNIIRALVLFIIQFKYASDQIILQKFLHVPIEHQA